MAIQNNQNIFDFTLENFGTLENLFNDVLLPNALNVDQEIKTDQQVNINTIGRGERVIKQQIIQENLIITNGEVPERVTGNWILATGQWDDAGTWIDTENWID